MMIRPAKVAATSMLALGVAFAATWLQARVPDRPTDLLWSIAALAFLGVGVVVVARQPGNRIGWWFSTAGLVWLFNGAAFSLADVWLASPTDVPVVGPVAAWLSGWLFLPALGVVVFAVPLVFPDGRLPSPRWRPVVAAGGGYITAVAIGAALWPGTYQFDGRSFSNPLGIGWLWWLPEPDSLVFGIPLLALLSAVAIVGRYRSSGDVERHQLKWFVAAVGLLVACFMLATVADWFLDIPWTAGDVSIPVALAMIPVSAGVAILRYRLYEIDRIISRTVSYALLSGLLAAVYLLAVMGLQQLLRPLMGDSQLAVAGATLLVAALFQPARRRIQATVDRRFNRARYDAQRTVDEFRARLRDKLDIDELTTELVTTADAAVAPATVQVWLRGRQPLKR